MIAAAVVGIIDDIVFMKNIDAITVNKSLRI